MAEPSINDVFAHTGNDRIDAMLGAVKRVTGLTAPQVRALTWKPLTNVGDFLDEEEMNPTTRFFGAPFGDETIIARVSFDALIRRYEFDLFQVERLLKHRFSQNMRIAQEEYLRLNTVHIGAEHVPVAFSVDSLAVMGKEAILGFKPFQDYCERLNNPAFRVTKIQVTEVGLFGKRIGYVSVKSDIKDTTGSPLPSCAILRGGSVAILVVLVTPEAEYVVIVRQARTPIGASAFAEIPAGMLDGSGDFTGKAAAEMKEELGITIDKNKLVDITALAYGENCPGVYTSPGLLDEPVRLMLSRHDVADIAPYCGGRHGLAAEGEVTVTDVVPLNTLWSITPDAKSVAAATLYRQLRFDGKI